MNVRCNATTWITLLTLVAFKPAFAEQAALPVDLFADVDRSVSLMENGTASSWAPSLVFEEAGSHTIAFRAQFTVETPKQFAALVLEASVDMNTLTLNGAPIPNLLEGMTYKTFPGIPSSMFKKGLNEFQASWTQRVKTQKVEQSDGNLFIPRQVDAADVTLRLLGLPSSALTFQTGPILGYAGEEMFTASCRVNIPAEVVLEVNDQQYVSEPALLHSFKVEGLTADTSYIYSLKARLSSRDDFVAVAGPYSMRTLPADGDFTFAILGDSRSRPSDWEKVASAVVKSNPIFSVFVGDMVGAGRRDHEWDEQLFSPARDFFATIPFYAIIGNHEQNCSLFPRIFPTPGGKNWSQTIGPVLLIGIDGSMDWSSGSSLTIWLEELLRNSEASFIFLASHYPAWSSGLHGALSGKGLPRETAARQAQEVLMPLLKKHNATAMFAGHDHFYERSEPEDGVTMIVTGGAGAPLRDKHENAEVQNPHSVVFAKQNHYCLLTLEGDACILKVLTPDGTVVDTLTWPARR